MAMATSTSTSTPQAKAWLYTSTSPTLLQTLQLTNYTVPDLTPNHLLIEVLNVSLNPGDTKFPVLPIINRFITKPASLCFDFCGRIRALPSGFTNTDARELRVGQVVFGMHRDIKDLGTLKTIMRVHKDSVYPLPDNFPVEYGSTLGTGAMTAYQAIAPHAKSGNRVLVNGGSGGVGIFAIQIAKVLGMVVVAVCSKAGEELCRGLGADEVLDYKKDTFLEDLCQMEKVDLVLDLVGYDTRFHRRSERFLKSDGQFVLVALMDHSWVGIWSMFLSWTWPVLLGGTPRKWRAVFTRSEVGDYEDVARLVREGEKGEGKGVRVVVDEVMPFGEVLRGIEKVMSGRVKGKVVVDVSDGGW